MALFARRRKTRFSAPLSRRASLGVRFGRDEDRPCLKSLLRFRPQLDWLENRLLPSVNLGVHVTGITQGNSSCGCEPPDPIAAAGPSNAVEMVNSAMQI